MSGTPRTTAMYPLPSHETGAKLARAAMAPRKPKASATGAVTANSPSTLKKDR